MDELLPCPWCDGPGSFIDLPDGMWAVRCHTCEIDGPVRMSEGLAAVDWNWRPREQELRAALAAAERERDALLRYGIGVPGVRD
jgi:hypothetical protein